MEPEEIADRRSGRLALPASKSRKIAKIYKPINIESDDEVVATEEYAPKTQLDITAKGQDDSDERRRRGRLSLSARKSKNTVNIDKTINLDSDDDLMGKRASVEEKQADITSKGQEESDGCIYWLKMVPKLQWFQNCNEIVKIKRASATAALEKIKKQQERQLLRSSARTPQEMVDSSVEILKVKEVKVIKPQRKGTNVIINARRQCLKGKRKPYDKPFNSDKLPKIQTRQSPSQLVRLMSSLKEERKANLEDLGFGKILSLKVDSIPLTMAYWILNRINEETGELKVGGKSIIINKQTVSSILGFPSKGDKVHTTERGGQLKTNLITKWRSQFPVPNKGWQGVYTSELMSKIVGDEMFKLNITLFIMTILAEGLSNGKVNCKFLPSIQDVQQLYHMDWCRYTITSMRKSIASWKKNPDGTWYTGPLLFLVLCYVETVCGWTDTSSAIENWTAEKLKSLEKKLKDTGGFDQRISWGTPYTQGDNKEQTGLSKPSQPSSAIEKDLVTPIHGGSDDIIHKSRHVTKNMNEDIPNNQVETSPNADPTSINEHIHDKERAEGESSETDDSYSRDGENYYKISELDAMLQEEDEAEMMHRHFNNNEVEYHDQILKCALHLERVKDHLEDMIWHASKKYPLDTNIKSAIAIAREKMELREKEWEIGTEDNVDIFSGTEFIEEPVKEQTTRDNRTHNSNTEIVLTGQSKKIDSRVQGSVCNARYADDEDDRKQGNRTENEQPSINDHYATPLPCTPSDTQMFFSTQVLAGLDARTDEYIKKTATVTMQRNRTEIIATKSQGANHTTAGCSVSKKLNFQSSFLKTNTRKDESDTKSTEPKYKDSMDTRLVNKDEACITAMHPRFICTTIEKLADASKEYMNNSDAERTKKGSLNNKIIDRSASILAKFEMEKEQMGIQSEIIGMEENPEQMIHIKETTKAKERRAHKPSAVLKSPYNNKEICIMKPLSPMEKKVTQWLFSGCGETESIVFQTGTHLIVVKPLMESLIPSSHVHVHVIDAWAAVLNHESRYDGASSTKRLFCGTIEMKKKTDETDLFVLQKVKHNGYGKFELRMKNCLKTSPYTLRTADLLFIPIHEGRHYYLICFDLKRGQIHIIDNIAYRANNFNKNRGIKKSGKVSSKIPKGIRGKL